MHVLNINSYLDAENGGGTAERTFQMSRFLARAGVQCTVLTTDTGLGAAREAAIAPAELFALPLLWKRFYVPKWRWRKIKELVGRADIIHLMGHWSVLNALVYIAARQLNKPYVVCPAGALPIFGRSSWLKRLFNALVGKAIIRNASAWIAVTAGEFPQFAAYGISASRITVIPNGVADDDFPAVDAAAFRRDRNLPDRRMILFMGRLNLIKGPDLLLEAFASVKDQIPDYDLVFAGPDEGMQTGLLEFAEKNNLIDRIHFLGYVSGIDKVAAYRLAELLVVPSRQEAMSIVALEAGMCGIPVLLTDQCGFSEVASIHAALEAPASAAGIAKNLVMLLTAKDLLDGLGNIFRDFVSQKYAWRSVVGDYLRVYADILKVIKDKSKDA